MAFSGDKVNLKVDMTNNTDKATGQVKKNLQSIGNEAEKTQGKLSKMFSGTFGNLKTSLLGVGLVGLSSKIIQATKKSSDYIETLNVLDVAFDGNTQSIRKFTSAISETLNLDDASIIKMAAAFKTLGNSMSYSQELGTKFSKMMTQVTLDTASLFNMSLAKSQSMMQSAIQGQGKSLKTNTGVSVLETTIQTTLDVLGIDAYVENMNDAEKALARTIAITYQLRNAQGDLSRTIEAPANQMRVFGEQISQVARNIGNVFLPMISAILPYLNAVLIVLNKLISSLARLAGFKENAWDNYSNSTEALAGAFDDLGTSVGGVGSAAKETKKQLMGLRGFDKLNVIKTPTSTGGSGGAGGGTGINQNLLDAFNKLDYKSALDGIETKATKIAKAIMKALGDIDFTNLKIALKDLWEAFKPFAKNVGEGLYWAFENILKPLAKWYINDYLPTWLELLASGFKVLNSAIKVFKPMGKWLFDNFLKPLAKFAGKTVVNWMKGIRDVLEGISKKPKWSALAVGATSLLLLYTNLGKLKELLGKSKLLGAVSDLLSPTKKLLDYVKTGVGAYGNLNTGIKNATDSWRASEGIIDKQTGKLAGYEGSVIAIKDAFKGLLVGTFGFAAVNTAFQDMATNGLNLSNALGGVAGAIGLISGAIQIGMSLIPHYGGLIGGLAGTVGLLITAFVNLRNSNKDATSELEEYEKAQKRLDDATRDKLETDVAELEHLDKLTEELGNLTDANGKVKKGYEKRVNFILNQLNDAFGTEYKLIDGVITKNGKAVDSYKEVENEIKETIKWKKAEAVAEAFKEDYINALKNEKKWQENIKEAEEDYNNTLQKTIDKYGEKGMYILNNTKLSDYEKAQLLRTTEEDVKATKKVIEWKKNQFEAVKQGYKDNEKVIKNYEDLQEAILDKDWKNTLKHLDNYIDTSKMKEENFTSDVKKILNNIPEYVENIFNKVPDTKNIKVNVDADTSSFTTKISNALRNVKIGKLSLSSIFKADGGILVNNKWRDIATYDTGGLPPVGQMFVARERGPELVGNIGGHTAVMNNNQIVSSVSSGVAQAVRSVMGNINSGGGVYNIYLDKDHKIGTYTLEQLQGMAKSNGRPITIG